MRFSLRIRISVYFAISDRSSRQWDSVMKTPYVLIAAFIVVYAVMLPGSNIGQVFTPWLRVVCFAKEQLAAGHVLDPANVPSDLAQPVVLIGFYGAPQDDGSSSETKTTVQAIPH